MNSYGDSNSLRGRAQVPGPVGPTGPEDDDVSYAPHRPPPAAPPVAGRASVGSPSARAAGSAAVGAARVGRASVGPGPDPDGYAGAGRDGYAGGRPVAGRATVGRAVVQPVSPAGPGLAGPELGRPVRPPKNPAAAKQAKRRRRANWVIGSLAVMVILAGAGVMGFTYYYDDIPTFSTSEVQTTTLTYADGKQLTKLGKENRTIVPETKIPPTVMNAVMAAEDKNYRDHNGIDIKGIARAAWNNFSGGDTQGASTITQQYARHAAKMKDISYNRKIREAVLARRLEQTKSKDEILGLYLNAIYFGRGAYGIEAAAQAYFGKSVTTPAGKPGAVTVEEAAVLASVIKQPEPDDFTGHKGFDPQVNLADAQERWNYTLGNMVEKGWITAEQRAAAKYPKVKKYNPKDCLIDCAGNKPEGHIIKQVQDELTEMGVPWTQGGYKVTTTIDRRAQDAAQNAARRASVESPMKNLPENHLAALVAVDPRSGGVLAYYGGDQGNGTDLAGLNKNPDPKNPAKTVISGGHPPGSSFKVFTLAAALREGIAMETRWDMNKKDGDITIQNAGREGDQIPCNRSCSLKESTVQSYNFPFYWIARDDVGPGRVKVVNAARDAGIRMMWTDQSEAVPLTDKLTESDAKKFGTQVGFGQYAVTVLDQANGMATIAARGKYNKAHFVRKVEKLNPATGAWERTRYGEQIRNKQVFDADQMDNLNGVLQEVPAASGKSLRNRPAAAKTGTWEHGKLDGNAHAWVIGATPQISAAVWVGEKDGGLIKTALRRGDMFGGDEPTAIWKKFMDEVHEKLNLDVERFPERKITGDPNHPAANGIQPVTRNPFCIDPNPITRRLCPDGQQGGNNGTPGAGNNNEIPALPGIPSLPGTGNNGGNQGGNNGGNEGNNNGGNQGNNNGGNQGNNNGNPADPFERPLNPSPPPA